MSWLSELEKVYDNTINRNSDDKPQPIFHISNNASVTITLDKNGSFIRAELIDSKSKSRITSMPCTESCSSRSNSADAYPLCEKIDYLFKDASKRSLYINLLKAWSDSSFSVHNLQAVYSYISNNNICEDIEKSGIKIADVSAFIRWKVEDCELWNDATIQDSWIRFYSSPEYEDYCKNNYSPDNLSKYIRKTDFDYVSGKAEKIAGYHPSKIRNGGDKAKLISSNDNTNYTFRGRFFNSDEACQISSITTQKAHSALRWLVQRQGYKSSIGDGLTLVTWNKAGDKLPSIIDDSESFGFDYGFDSDEKETVIYQTNIEFAKAMNKRLTGFYGDISKPENIMIMGIKEATPGQGRASIILYREILNSDLVESLNNWFTDLAWYISYKDKSLGSWVNSIGTPSPRVIVDCAYGDHVKGNTVEKTIQRLLPCILDGSKIPSDIETQCLKSASNLFIVEGWKRSQILGTACAVYKYNQKKLNKEDYKLALEESRTSRDYLYGRLLAVAQQYENAALKKMNENRETNATRYMQQFSVHPATTWRFLYEKKLPAYKRHLEPGLINWFEKKIQDISSLFNVDDYINDKPLSGEYLLGYQCQLKDFSKKTDSESEENNLEDK